MGIVLTYDQAISSPADFGILSYLSISVSLNVLLTFMIVIQLAIHTRNIRTVMGTLGGISGLYKAIATMLIESCALYAVNSLLVIIPVAASSNVINTFPILAQTQVRTFPYPQSSDRLPNVTTDLTGHRFTAHHSTSRR